MNNHSILKAIFLDVDGTLLSFSSHTVPVSTITALEKLHHNGIKIIIATGRSANNLAEISMIPYEGVIGLNGADCVLCDGTIIDRRSIPLDLFKKSMELAQKYDFAIAVEGNDGIFVDKLNPRVIEMASRIDHPVPEVKDLWQVYKEGETAQFCFFTDEETEGKIMSELPGLASSRWCDIFADINMAGTNKAAGVEAFIRHLGINQTETIAFGDGGNDIPMLQKVGIGVAMGNASEEVKKYANYITDTVDDDGLSNALKHFRLI